MPTRFPLVLLASLTLLLPVHAQDAGPYDVLFLGGHVVDGAGRPWIRADVGVRDGRIADVGNLAGAEAGRVIDARGLTVVPGFIDLHSHAADAGFGGGLGSGNPHRRAAPNLVTQGITTVVVNQDGRSAWPIADQRGAFERLGIGPNAALLAGHGTVRIRILGHDAERAATSEEIEAMRGLVRQAMREGAFGLSAGLEYAPGRWSTTDEVAALVEEIVPFGGVYIAHQRSEGSDPMWYLPSVDSAGPPTLLDAVRETIEIGARTGGRVVASHIKAKGAHYRGSSEEAIRLIREARSRGVQVWADQYPYTSSGSDGSTVLIPDWALRVAPNDPDAAHPYAASLGAVLRDARLADALRRDVAHELRRRGGAGRVVVFDHPDSTLIGTSLADLAEDRGLTPVEAAVALQLEGFAGRPGGARLRGFSMDQQDVDAYAVQPWTATASDAGIALPDDPPVHARYYGTFPRKLRDLALERGVLSVEDAVRSSTSLPAQILGLKDRGLVRPGYRADLAVIDLERVRDTATFTDPHRYAAGIPYVLVGGTFVVDQGAPTGALPGRVLSPDP